MKKKESTSWPWLTVMSLIVSIVLVSAWMVGQPQDNAPVQAAELGQARNTLAWKALDKPMDAQSAFGVQPAMSPSQAMTRHQAPSSALDSTTYPDFRADKQGRLVLDELTKEGFERIVALNERDAAQARVSELSKHLPAGAQRQAEDLYFRYQQYTAALAQAFTPGEQPPGDDAALQQLDTLHALRVEHFGAATAKALFGSDEETARQLILLTRSQDAPDLSHEQKVELAQQTYSRMKAAANPPK